jgi:ABC-type uncharacterized transport system substrate-binding protein
MPSGKSVGWTIYASGLEALYVCTDPLVSSNLARINTLALGARLPTMHGVQEYVEAGGLMSYGANFPDLFRRAAEFVNKILRGERRRCGRKMRVNGPSFCLRPRAYAQGSDDGIREELRRLPFPGEGGAKRGI